MSASVSDTGSDAVVTVTSDPVFPFDSQYHHVAAVIDRAADELRIYLDGGEVGSTDISSIGDIGPPSAPRPATSAARSTRSRS